MRKLIYYWLPVVVWAAIIIQATGRRFDAPHTSGWLATFLSDIGLHIADQTLQLFNAVLRKAGHLTAYAIMALVSFRAVREGRRGFTLRWALIALAITVCVASTDEFLQSFTPTRGSSVWDVLLDTFGGTLAMLGMWRHER
jgi:VanZ family protein